MPNRSFGGYACVESLSVGLFGEYFLARNKDGIEARVVVVDTKLSRRQKFANALAEHGAQLVDLVHPHIVSTKSIGRGKDGNLVVITSSVDDGISLESLVASKEIMTQDLALSISMGLLRGLSYAHDHAFIHGAIHPRSILLDNRGICKIADFGIARAFIATATDETEAELLSGIRGYVAPEIALGQAPQVSSDVYACGILISRLLWQTSAPPDSDESSLATAIRGALAKDPKKRLPDAGALERAMRQAITDEDIPVASPLSLADTYTAIPQDYPVEVRKVATGEVADDYDAESVTIADAHPLLEEDEERTNVDTLRALNPPANSSQNPLEDVPIESPVQPVEPADSKRVIPQHLREQAKQEKQEKQDKCPSIGDLAQNDCEDFEETPLPVPRPFHESGPDQKELVELVGQQSAASSPFDDVDDLPVDSSVRNHTMRWVGIIAFVVAALVAVAVTQTDVFNHLKREKQDRANSQQERAAKSLPTSGSVVLRSKTTDAAVWLLLGKTPVQSFPVLSSMAHDLRMEHPGYRPMFLSITGQHWTGEANNRRAELSVSLLPESENSQLAAFPPIADPPRTTGGKGQGPILVKSRPQGAEVWMYVGTTPEMKLVGIEAGQRYEFKILKRGYRPGQIIVEAKDWYLSGASGPMRPEQLRDVVLKKRKRTTTEKAPLIDSEKISKPDSATPPSRKLPVKTDKKRTNRVRTEIKKPKQKRSPLKQKSSTKQNKVERTKSKQSKQKPTKQKLPTKQNPPTPKLGSEANPTQ